MTTIREFADGVVRYWVLVVFGVGAIGSIAVGADKLNTLEESVRAQQTQATAIQGIETKQAVTATKVDNLEEIAKQNQAILLQLLQKVK